MNDDLKIIKKKYGEKFMHLVRELFPSILETKGLLPKLLLDNFNESHFLYDDLIEADKTQEFQKYIYSLAYLGDGEITKTDKSPFQLLKEAGYTLYECKSESDIQAFRKYYACNEELCTFWTNRLNSCYVFFAVKDNAEEVRREDFKNPKRQDEYGTSVISIQFTRNEKHALSIKNRYNHKVDNPDATFGNNLDNIIAGLTYSFEKYYGMKQKNKKTEFEISGYVRADDGKFYKYNYEINNIYYCPDNILIKDFLATKYSKERYLVIDYFILDLEKKEIFLIDHKINDGLISVIGKITDIKIRKEYDKKIIYIDNSEGENFEIEMNEKNQIIGFKSSNVMFINRNFLFRNETIKRIHLPNVMTIGNSFLQQNQILEELDLSRVDEIGNNFLCGNRSLRKLLLPKLEQVGDGFLQWNQSLEELYVPNLKWVNSKFLYSCTSLKTLYAPSLEYVAYDFISMNENLEILNLPNLKVAGNNFLSANIKLKSIYLPNLKYVRDCFLTNNNGLDFFIALNLQSVGSEFLALNSTLTSLDLPSLKKAGDLFLGYNRVVTSVHLNNLEKVGYNFLQYALFLKQLYVPNLEEIPSGFLELCPIKDEIIKQIMDGKGRK